jgi:osmotically inducible protein OsmC
MLRMWKLPFGFNTRFEDEPDINPEELIGAAPAGCFAVALSNEKNMAKQPGLPPDCVRLRSPPQTQFQASGFWLMSSV